MSLKSKTPVRTLLNGLPVTDAFIADTAAWVEQMELELIGRTCALCGSETVRQWLDYARGQIVKAFREDGWSEEDLVRLFQAVKGGK